METEIRHSSDRDQLVLKYDTDRQADDYEWKIFIRNKIPGLLECSCRSIDGSTEYCYDITSLKRMTSPDIIRTISADMVRGLFNGILNTMENMEDCMLNTGRVILSPEFVFMDTAGTSPRLCFSPVPGPGTQPSFKELASFLLEHVPLNDNEASSLVFRIYRHTVMNGAAPPDIRDIITPDPDMPRITSGPFDDPFPSPVYDDEPDMLPENDEAGSAHEIRKRPGIIRRLVLKLTGRFRSHDKNNQGPYTDSSNDTGFYDGDPEFYDLSPGTPADHFTFDGEEEPATVLMPGASVRARLTPSDPSFPSGSPGIRSFTIGKHKELCDLVINSPAVSRLHARITFDDGIYYICDLNSSNGTFVNNEPVGHEIRIPLKNGDILCFADVAYSFDTACKNP